MALSRASTIKRILQRIELLSYKRSKDGPLSFGFSGDGGFRERRLCAWGRGLGQAARLTAGSLATRPCLGLGLQAPARSSDLPSVTGSVSHRSRHLAIFRTCRREGCVFGLAVLALVLLCLKNRGCVRRPEGTQPARPLPAVPSTQATSGAWWWPHCLSR